MHRRCSDTYGSGEEMQVQRGHRGRTGGAHQIVTDARVGRMVRVRVRHVIDKRDKARSP